MWVPPSYHRLKILADIAELIECEARVETGENEFGEVITIHLSKKR